MKYVLTHKGKYRQADGVFTDEVDHAERFSHDAAVVRRDELSMQGVATRIVETSGRKRNTTEAMVMRITKNLDKLEQAWAGKTIGIGYDIDVEVGRINLIFEPDGEPENALVVHVDVADIMIGQGDEN
jgi:sulfate adenylyltransferase subunit 1 (EFTu-like GTPase family)